MNKIKFNKINEYSEYRLKKTIELADGETETIYVKNPVNEIAIEIKETIIDILENDKHILPDGTEITDEKLTHYLIKLLTNIEIEYDDIITDDCNIIITEVLGAIHDIHSEQLIKVLILLSTQYNEEKNAFYFDKVRENVESYNSMISNNNNNNNKDE